MPATGTPNPRSLALNLGILVPQLHDANSRLTAQEDTIMPHPIDHGASTS